MAQMNISIPEKLCLRGFDDAFALIAGHPLIGPLCDAVHPPIHGLPHGSHRIFYDVFADRMVVQRILHERMAAGQQL